MSLVINNLDKEELKAIIREVIKEDPNIFKAIIKEILEDIGQKNLNNSNTAISEEELKERRQILAIIGQKNLEHFDISIPKTEWGFKKKNINLSANLATVLKEDKEVLQKLAK